MFPFYLVTRVSMPHASNMIYTSDGSAVPTTTYPIALFPTQSWRFELMSYHSIHALHFIDNRLDIRPSFDIDPWRSSRLRWLPQIADYQVR